MLTLLIPLAVFTLIYFALKPRVNPTPAADNHPIVPGLLTMHQCMEGIAAIAGPGAGKTTGPLAHIAINIASHPSRPGMLILCAKPDEAQRWRYYCEQAGRADDYIHFAPGKHSCDVITYELSQPGATIAGTAALIDTLMKRESQGQSGGSEGPFWAMFAEQIARCSIGVLWMGLGRASMLDMPRLVADAPKNLKEVGDPAWQKDNFCWEVISKANEKANNNAEFREDFLAYQHFWLTKWSGMGERTRAIGEIMLSNVTSKYLDGPMARMVGSKENTASPDDVLNGRILVLDMPALVWYAAGINFQILMKSLVQRAALRRDSTKEQRPVVCWADEAQFFIVSSTDMMNATVSRQARFISVIAFQNLQMMYSNLGGGDKARQEVDGLLSCYMTKFIGANTCVVTNKYFSDLAGYSWHEIDGGGGGGGEYDIVSDMMGQPSVKGGPTMNWRMDWRPDVPPEHFTRVQKGGAPNYTVETVMIQGGRQFDNGKIWTPAYFPQYFPPTS